MLSDWRGSVRDAFDGVDSVWEASDGFNVMRATLARPEDGSILQFEFSTVNVDSVDVWVEDVDRNKQQVDAEVGKHHYEVMASRITCNSRVRSTACSGR